MLLRVIQSDINIDILEFISICDIFALSFVSRDIRKYLTGFTQKWKYLRKRGLKELMKRVNPCGLFANLDYDVMKMLNGGRGFISGSFALQIILGTTWDSDLDLFFPGNLACERAISASHTKCYRNDLDANVYSINKVAGITHQYWCGPGRELDIMDSMRSDPNDFDMTIVQNWLWYDGRIKIMDPWAIIHRQIKFTNMCKREIRGHAAIVASVIFHHTDRSLHMELEYDIRSHTSPATPLVVRLDLLESRVKKYKDRGFHLYDCPFSLCIPFGAIYYIMRRTFPELEYWQDMFAS